MTGSLLARRNNDVLGDMPEDTTLEGDIRPASGWRRIVGIALFGLSLALPLIALIVVPILGLPKEMNTVLFGLSVVGGPDVLLIAAVAVLGRDGVTALMSKFGAFGKRVFRWDSVTKTRYTVGLVVLVIAMVAPLIPLVFWESSVQTIDGGPGWGFYLGVASVFVFITAVLSMGAPLWARIEAIVTWDAEISFPADEN